MFDQAVFKKAAAIAFVSGQDKIHSIKTNTHTFSRFISPELHGYNPCHNGILLNLQSKIAEGEIKMSSGESPLLITRGKTREILSAHLQG